MKIIAVIFSLIIYCLLGTAAHSAPKTSTQFEELKSKYLSLRNTDIDLERSEEWRSLAKAFRQYSKRNSKAPDAPRSLYHAALLSEELYQRYRLEEDFTQSKQDYTEVAESFHGSDHAPIALFRLGELYEERGELDKAKGYFKQVLIKFPDSEYAALATERLRQKKAVQEKVTERPDPVATKLGSSQPVIVIDPGHGGEDFGAVGVGGLLEKDVTLAVAFELEKLLKSRMGAVVRLTRRKDVFIPLAERTAMANDFDASIFVSIHVNASPNAKLSGTETYILDNAGDRASKLLAERENASTRFEGPKADLQYMLSDLIQNAKMADSYLLAKSVQGSLLRHIDTLFDSSKDLGVKRAPFYVLVGAHMPCVLVELAFIDHPTEGQKLADKEYRRVLAQGLYVGIRKYFDRIRG